jgi:hypothetical protein
MNEYWDNYGKKYGEVLQAAEILAKYQTKVNAQFTAKSECIFDKCLDDVTLYRKDGKWLSPYHAALYNKRKNNEPSCPVYDIMLQAIKQSEYNKKYAKAISEPRKRATLKEKFNLLGFDMAKRIFYTRYLDKAFEYKRKDYILDNHNEQVIDNLIAYFTRQQDSVLDLNKGICLFGEIGTGKSTIMKLFSKFTREYKLSTQFEFIYMDDIYSECDSRGLEALNSYKFRRCCFDDIGMRGENDINNFGTKMNPYKELVRRQYNRFSRTIPSLSHYTTNIQYHNKDFTPDLVKTFGVRELDRFREMCNFVYLGGDARRDY